MYIFDHGDTYFGGMANGKFHGEGTYTWSNGNEWTGQWNNGEQSAGKSTNLDQDVLINQKKLKMLKVCNGCKR